MTELQIKEHETMKKKFPMYPRLPRYILDKNLQNYVEPNQGLKDSCMGGFLSRLQNWKKSNNLNI